MEPTRKLEDPARGPPAWIVLGSGTALPSPRRAPSGAILQADRATFLVDPGPGALSRACAAGCPAHAIDEVLLTHHHPDHCLDLVALLFARNNPRWGAPSPGADETPRVRRPLIVRGGPGTEGLVSGFARAFGPWVRPDARVRVEEIGPGTFDASGGVRVDAVALEHTPASLGYRFTLRDGTVLAVSGDTAPCDGAVELGRDADHYVLEASTADEDPMPGHLTPSRAARIAAAAGCRHLILTHFYCEPDPVETRARVGALFPGRLTLAEDGMRIPLAPVARAPAETLPC